MGAVANATGAPRAVVFSVCRRSIEKVSKMLTLRGSWKSATTSIVKIRTAAIAKFIGILWGATPIATNDQM